MKRYLSEMLGPLAHKPAIEARYFDWEGVELVLMPTEGETIQRLLRRTPLPFRVEWGSQVRYL